MKLLRVLAALLIFAAAASASLSPWLALIAAWAGLIVLLLAAIDWYRTSLERGSAPPDVIVARVQKGRVIRVKQPKEKA